MRHARRQFHDNPERGSISAWAATSAVIMLMCVGVAVDLSSQVRAQRHAYDVAAQAARAGGAALDSSSVEGRYPSLAVGQAQAAVDQHLAATGVTGTMTITDGTTVHVTVTDTYDPLFLGIVGLHDLTVHGDATARVIRTMGDNPR